MEKNLFERGKTKISVPLISCEDKNKEKMSLFEVVEIEKITKNKPSLLFTNNGSFFINNFSKNHRIFVGEKLHLGIDCKQACISALGLQYLCRRKAALGNLKASFHCARLHFLCRRKAALGNLKASFHCARLHFLCKRDNN